MAQDICYVAYAIRLLRRQVNGRDNSRALGSNNGVAGNGVIEKPVEFVHLEEQVFAELVRVGVAVLTVFSLQSPCQDGGRVKTFLGEAADECEEFSLRMMYGPRDS